MPPAPRSPSRRQPLYQQMMDTLRRRIDSGELQPDSPAPSESALIAEFRVSSTTARRCLNELAQQGLVHRIQGKGTFVADLATLRASRQIGILYHDLINLTDTFSATALRGIDAETSAAGFQPALLQLGGIAHSPEPAAALAALVRRHQLRGLLLMSPVPPPWLDAVLEAGMPVASANFTYDDERISCAVGDVDTALHRLGERIAGCGHQRIALLRGRFDQSLVAGVGMLRIEPPQLPGVTWDVHTFRYFKPAEVAQIVTEQLTRRDPPTAFLCYGYEAALEAAAVIRERGWSIPQDASVAFIGVPPGPTSFSGEAIPIRDIAGQAARMLIDRLAGRDAGPRVVRLAPHPQPGSTLGRTELNHSRARR